MKRYLSKSIVTFSILAISILVLLVAAAFQIRGEPTCVDCYESDKGQFKYVLYDGTSPSVIPSIHNTLLINRTPLMKTFELDSMPAVTVRCGETKKPI
ncbi:hypothetical protein O9853_24720 [Vibrio lentus]|nr:hypothetical protein [Vibrio lentus]